jgi:ParB family chromosome partitioning protein
MKGAVWGHSSNGASGKAGLGDAVTSCPWREFNSPTRHAPLQGEETEHRRVEMKEEKIKLAGLRFSSNRAYGGDGDIEILAEDIKRNGIINPVTVKAIPEEEEARQTRTAYEVIAGRRRVQAARLLGWKDIPSRILEGDEIDRAEEIAGSENINRMAMHPLDEAIVFSKLIESGRPIEELAKQYDRSVSAIWQRIQLLGLSDDIKALFRNGYLSLHAAAMLKSLDEKGQEAFYNKFKDHWSVKKQNEIPLNEIRDFLSSRMNNKLFSFIETKECKTCQKRTFYKDKGLFPELVGVDDSCLDRDCYMKRWNALIAAKIKNLKKESPTHAGSAILAVGGGLKKWLGKNPEFNGTTYEVRSAQYNEITNQPGENNAPCVMIELNWKNELEISAGYWKQQPASSGNPRQESSFAPIVKLLDLPKAEAAKAAKALKENSGKLDRWDLDREVREKTFWRLMEERAKRPPGEHEVALYLENNVFDTMDGEKKRLYKLFIGEEYSDASISKLKDLPLEKLFFVMEALRVKIGFLPSLLYGFRIDGPSESNFLAWLGVSKDDIKKLYQEEIKALMPKAEPPDAGKKPAKAKAARGGKQ